MTATFHNTTLNETYTMAGIKDLAQAWNLGEFACSRKGWNPIDLTNITLAKSERMPNSKKNYPARPLLTPVTDDRNQTETLDNVTISQSRQSEAWTNR